MFINLPKHKFKRSLNLFMLCVIGVGGTIGGGIFVLLSVGAGVAGEYLPLSFLLGGALAFMGAMLYAELGTMIPKSGASIELVFSSTRRKYLPFMFSWLVMLGDVGYLVINALGLAFYANFFISVNPLAMAAVAIAISVLINLRGVFSTGKVEVFTETSLVLLLVTFVVMAVSGPQFQFLPGEFVAQIPFNVAAIVAATALIFTTFVGYEYIASIAEEAEEPAKNIPRALMISVVIATTIFTLVSAVAVNTVPVDELAASDAPLLYVAESLGAWGTVVILPAALIATAGSLIAATLVSSRRLYALSQQGYFKKLFSPLNGNDVPHRSILAVAVLATFLLLSNSVAFIAYISNTVYLIVIITIALTLMRFRRDRPYIARPYRAPFFPWLPLLMIVIAVSILFFVGTISLAATGLWLLLGYMVYLATRIHPAKVYWMMWGGVVFLLLFGLVNLYYLL